MARSRARPYLNGVCWLLRVTQHELGTKTPEGIRPWQTRFTTAKTSGAKKSRTL